MLKPLFLVSLLALALAACGPAAGPASDGAGAKSDARTPQVGDRIPEPERDLASSNRLAAAGAEANDVAARGVREIGWEELMPEGEEERLAEIYQQQMAKLYSSAPVEEGSAADAMIQIGTFNTVDELDGLKIRIPGYTVPFEYGADAEISEFLLVPYYGACIHAPPPPPNQTVFVTTQKPIKLRDLAQAVWVEGTLHAERQNSDLADAAYTIRLETIEEYTY